MTCTLYLMRHGIAADPVRGMNDADRALTEEGIRKTTRVAVGLQRLGVQLDSVLASPFRRTDETARLVAAVLCPTVTVELYPALSAGASAQDILRNLKPARAIKNLMLVGHQPDLGDLASYLMTGSASLTPLPFRKAGVAAITVATLPPRAAGILEWFLTPSQLRAIADSSK